MARLINRGWPPTERKARTGLFTPPGINVCASANSLAERVVFIMGAHSTTQSSLGQERGGSCGAIRQLESKSVRKIRFSALFAMGCFIARIGIVRNPLQINRFMVPIEYGPGLALLGILERYDTNDESHLFVVPTRREIRAGRREGASRRCSGNAWDLCPSSPQCSSSLAGINSCRRTFCRRGLIICRTPPRDRRLFLSIAGSYAPIFP